MIFNINQEYILYLFCIYNLINKDHKNDEIYNHIIQVCSKNFYNYNNLEIEMLAQYIDGILHNLNTGTENCNRYVYNKIHYIEAFKIYTIALRKYKLNNIHEIK